MSDDEDSYLDNGLGLMLMWTVRDGNIRYFEYEKSDKLEYLSEYKSVDPQRGIAFLPKRAINVRSSISLSFPGRVQMFVPRRMR